MFLNDILQCYIIQLEKIHYVKIMEIFLQRNQKAFLNVFWDLKILKTDEDKIGLFEIFAN